MEHLFCWQVFKNTLLYFCVAVYVQSLAFNVMGSLNIVIIPQERFSATRA